MAAERQSSQESQGDTGWLGLLLMFIGLWAFANVFIVYLHQTAVLDSRLVDTDSYMRLVRIQILLDQGEWFNSFIDRSNWPQGETLHWTRPFDVLILLLRAPLTLFLSDTQALYWAGVIVSPLLQLAIAIGFFWAFRPFSGQLGLALATIGLIIQPAIIDYLQPGRADHHGLLLLTFVLAIGCTVRTMISPTVTRWALFAGALSALGLWFSIELLPLMAAIALTTSGAWIIAPKLYLRSGLAFGLSLVFVTGLAILVEHPPGQYLTIAYDKISFAQFAVVVLVLGFWVVIASPLRLTKADNHFSLCLVATALWGVLCLLGLYHFLPGHFQGPMAAVDPGLIELWFNQISELKPLIPRDLDSFGRMIKYLGLGFVALPFLLYQLWFCRHQPIGFAWCFLAVMALGYTVLALLSARLSAFTEILYIGILANLLHYLSLKIENLSFALFRSLLRAALILVLIGAAPLIGNAIENQAKATRGITSVEAIAKTKRTILKACNLRNFSIWLNQESAIGSGARPLTILASLDAGPELLYRTPHRVIATPYHRNEQGLWDGYNSFATNDWDEARELMKAHEVELVLVCPESPERAFFSQRAGDKAVYNKLVEGSYPPWIEPVTLPAELAEFQLFQVKP